MIIKFEIECDKITERQRELIHIYIRQKLQKTNNKLIIKGLWK